MKKSVYYTFSMRALFGCVMCILFGASIVVLIYVINNQPTVEVYNPIGEREYTIIIDAGHGGEDGGTQSAQGILEKDINLKISEKVDILLKVMGYDTCMTRQGDNLIYSSGADTLREKKSSDLNNRLSLALKYENPIFLSIHQNYFTQSKYYGAQVFYSGNNPDSRLLAQELQRTITENIQQENSREIKKSGSEIFLLNRLTCPAVMVECGFLSNPEEAQLLNDSVYRKKLSLCIVAGIHKNLTGSDINAT